MPVHIESTVKSDFFKVPFYDYLRMKKFQDFFRTYVLDKLYVTFLFLSFLTIRLQYNLEVYIAFQKIIYIIRNISLFVEYFRVSNPNDPTL
jgi:hypothetical protein